MCVRLTHHLKQILGGIYPVSQLQEPYSSVGYLCERTNFRSILKLKHPNHSPGTPCDPDTEDWTAWDVCEGVYSSDVASFILYLTFDWREELVVFLFCFFQPGLKREGTRLLKRPVMMFIEQPTVYCD